MHKCGACHGIGIIYAFEVFPFKCKTCKGKGEVADDYATAKADAERGIAKIKADALREAVEEFESHVGAGEFEEQTCRNGTHWTHAVESWDHQGPFMYWLLNRADRIEREA